MPFVIRWAAAVLSLAALAASLAGCGTTEIRSAYAVDTPLPAPVAGFTGVRFWSDVESAELKAAIARRAEQELKASGGRPVAFTGLALSGGADDGAFGAGLLVGWSERGDRPNFAIVTGVSTGALIAPLAFVGTARDRDLTHAFTAVEASAIFRRNGLIEGLLGESLTSTEPLQMLVARYVDERLLGEIAAEHAKGRRLRVLTTNLDAQRPVAWDIGEIATQGGPKALKLIRDCIVASASVPGLFPPVMIEAVVDGRPIREMHVDGGTTRNVFLIPPTTKLSGVRWSNDPNSPARLYVIFNGRLDPEFAVVERRTLDIASRAISTLIKSHGQSTLRELQVFAAREKAVLKVASIGPDFKERSPEPFDNAYMNKLFDYGRSIGRSGAPWR